MQILKNILLYAPLKRDVDETNYGGSLAQSVEQRTFNPLVESSNLSQPTTGCLAQLGEHLPYKERVIGSIPIATTTYFPSYGRLAQLGEHLPNKEGVTGSRPVATTNHFNLYYFSLS